MLGAVAAGLLLDLDEDAIATGSARLGRPGAIRGRGSRQPFTVVVDYAHTPDSLETVLARRAGSRTVVSSLSSGPGETATAGKRPLMGRVAAELADHVIVTSDNPRSEEPVAIIAEVLQGTGVDVEMDPDRRTAIGRAIAVADEGDVVVIAGKGHEQGQEIDGVVHPSTTARSCATRFSRGRARTAGRRSDTGSRGGDRRLELGRLGSVERTAM